MPRLVRRAAEIRAEGKPPKRIREFVGRVNTGTAALSVAHMKSPRGWSEPGQTPDFDEMSIVLRGTLHVEHLRGAMDVRRGQAVMASAGEWVRYSTPHRGGAEYVAVCLPAFSPKTVHRDA